MLRHRLLLAGLLVTFAPAVQGGEFYIVRVRAHSTFNAGACSHVFWQDNVVFYNAASTSATIRLLEVSNGGLLTPPALNLEIPGGETRNSAGRVNWDAASQDVIWVNKIEVPDAVLLRSRAEGGFAGCFGIPPSGSPDFGAFSLPVFDQLVPAGRPQIHLGADLGAQPSSLNVGIYNDAVSSSTATVEIRQVCDDAIRETYTFTIPAKTVLQFGGLGLSGTSCPSSGSEFNFWMRYVIVTADQPGFSYIVNRSTAIPSPPVIPYASP